MAITTRTEQQNGLEKTPSFSRDSLERIPSTQMAYHELAEVPVQEVDQLDLLHKNLEQLSDIRSRLQFMMKEIRYVMKV